MPVILAAAQSDLESLLEQLSSPGAKQMAEVGMGSFLLLMAISALTGLFVSVLYRVFFRARATGSEMHRAFPLISISVTAIFVTIQYSLPLSLGLLGALSIVRFRTPVKEPEEIGFLMLVVACGLCCATFNLFFLGVVLIVATTMLVVLNLRSTLLGGPRQHGMVVLTLPIGEYQASGNALLQVLGDKLPGGRLDSINESAEEAVLSYSFPKLAQQQALDLQTTLRGIAAGVRSDLYFSRNA